MGYFGWGSLGRKTKCGLPAGNNKLGGMLNLTGYPSNEEGEGWAVYTVQWEEKLSARWDARFGPCEHVLLDYVLHVSLFPNCEKIVPGLSKDKALEAMHH